MKLKDLNNVTFFSNINDDRDIFAEYLIPAQNKFGVDVKKISHIDSEEFKHFIEYVEMEKNDEISYTSVINDVKAICCLYGNPDHIEPKIRIGGRIKKNLIEYALYDSAENYVAITPNGWQVIKNTQHKFIHPQKVGTQLSPKKSDVPLLTLLGKYINADKDSKILFTVWLIQAFSEGNHSALLIMAQKGSGKSTLTKMIRKILDPSLAETTVLPNKIDNLITTLTNSYLVTFDNTDILNKEASDILCTAVTGGTYAKRVLYTTNQIAILNLHNTIVINGIDIIPTESDFADRCLFLKLEKITAEKRMIDSTITQDFNNDLPFILGGIFDTLSKAMKIAPSLNPTRLPRMAESFLDMLAIAVALGITADEFTRIYSENLSALNKARSNTDLINVVREYMFKQPGRSVEGTVSTVYNKILASTSNKNCLPKTPSHFSRKLNAEHSSFFAAGLIINIDDTYADGTHLKIIKK